MEKYSNKRYYQSAASLSLLALCACNPTVTLETSDKPVRIDLNIKIDHEVRVKIE